MGSRRVARPRGKWGRASIAALLGLLLVAAPAAADDDDDDNDRRPSCRNLSATVAQGGSVVLTPVCTSPTRSALTWFVTSGPANGQVTGDGRSGPMTYTPRETYTGQDRFRFRVVNAEGRWSRETVATISVQSRPESPPATPGPVCADLMAVLDQDAPAELELRCTLPGGTAITHEIVEPPAHGTLGPVDAGGKVVYTPAAGYTGADRFSYRAVDDQSPSAVAVVTLDVRPARSGPAMSPPSSSAPAPLVSPPSSSAPASLVSTPSSSAPAPLRALSPFPVVRLLARVDRRGARVLSVTVTGPRRARIAMRCRGRGCPARGWSGQARRSRTRIPRFPRSLGSRAVLEIRVTAPGRIGKLTRFTIRSAKPPRREDLCLVPGQRRPTRCAA
jgi:hypothetical protein